MILNASKERILQTFQQYFMKYNKCIVLYHVYIALVNKTYIISFRYGNLVGGPLMDFEDLVRG